MLPFFLSSPALFRRSFLSSFALLSRIHLLLSLHSFLAFFFVQGEAGFLGDGIIDDADVAHDDDAGEEEEEEEEEEDLSHRMVTAASQPQRKTKKDGSHHRPISSSSLSSSPFAAADEFEALLEQGGEESDRSRLGNPRCLS